MPMSMRSLGVAAIFALAAACKPTAAGAAEIRVLASGALKLALTRLAPAFEKSSGDTVSVAYGPAGSVANRVQAGAGRRRMRPAAKTGVEESS
jgi:molybdate transport system substrate-binding protein